MSAGLTEMRHAEAFAPRLAGRVDVDTDDDVGAGHARALDDVEADAAEPEDDDIVARPHIGGVDDGADAGGDAAADVAARLERRVAADLRDGDLGQHGEVGKGRAAHVVVQHLALVGKARGAIGHHAAALGGADGGAQIGLARQARLTLAAFGRVERDDMVADRDAGNAGADFADDTGAFMAEDRREQAFAVETIERIGIGVADAGRHDLDQHLAGARAVEIDLDDFERRFRCKGDGGAGLHFGSFSDAGRFVPGVRPWRLSAKLAFCCEGAHWPLARRCLITILVLLPLFRRTVLTSIRRSVSDGQSVYSLRN